MNSLLAATENSQNAYSSQSKDDLRRALKYDPENYQLFNEGKNNVMLGVFPSQQRLCSQYAYIKTPLVNGTSTILLRPSFSFPFIKPPNMIPCVDPAVILAQFSSEKGQIPITLKPEAPWIKKDSKTGSVKFTDAVYLSENSTDACETPESEKEKRQARRDKENERYAEIAVEPLSQSQPVFLKKNIFE